MRRRAASVEKKKVKSTSGQVETFRFALAASDGREFCLELHEGRSVLAGRDLGAEVVIPDGRVSRHHSSLSLEDARLWIEDLHSQNGTLVNNEKIQRALLEVICNEDTGRGRRHLHRHPQCGQRAFIFYLN